MTQLRGVQIYCSKVVLAGALLCMMFGSFSVLAGGTIFGGHKTRTSNPNGVTSIGIYICGSLNCPDVIIKKGDCGSVEHATTKYGVCVCEDGYTVSNGQCVEVPSGGDEEPPEELPSCNEETPCHSISTLEGFWEDSECCPEYPYCFHVDYVNDEVSPGHCSKIPDGYMQCYGHSDCQATPIAAEIYFCANGHCASTMYGVLCESDPSICEGTDAPYCLFVGDDGEGHSHFCGSCDEGEKAGRVPYGMIDAGELFCCSSSSYYEDKGQGMCCPDQTIPVNILNQGDIYCCLEEEVREWKGIMNCCPEGTDIADDGLCCLNDQIVYEYDGNGYEVSRTCCNDEDHKVVDNKCCPLAEIATDNYGNEQCCSDDDGLEPVGGECCPIEKIFFVGEAKLCCDAYPNDAVVNGECCTEDGNGNSRVAQDEFGNEVCCDNGEIVNGICIPFLE